MVAAAAIAAIAATDPSIAIWTCSAAPPPLAATALALPGNSYFLLISTDYTERSLCLIKPTSSFPKIMRTS